MLFALGYCKKEEMNFTYFFILKKNWHNIYDIYTLMWSIVHKTTIQDKEDIKYDQ